LNAPSRRQLVRFSSAQSQARVLPASVGRDAAGARLFVDFCSSSREVDRRPLKVVGVFEISQIDLPFFQQ
jgi:hypothetical protein